MVKYWYTCLTSNVYDSMIYMITKKHDTINLIKYNIIFIRLRLLSETIFSTANPHVFLKPFCNATPRNNHRCPRDPSTTLTKWCEKHRCVHPAKGNFQWSAIACYTFASPDAYPGYYCSSQVTQSSAVPHVRTFTFTRLWTGSGVRGCFFAIDVHL